MLDISEVAYELKEQCAWQATPTDLTITDYINMVKRAVRRFFVDINRPGEYSANRFIEEDGFFYYDREFMVDEIEYLLCLCKIEFFQRVQTDVNDAFSYSTDALVVTNADKPYANLKNTINDLFRDRRILFNKMVRYTLGEG